MFDNSAQQPHRVCNIYTFAYDRLSTAESSHIYFSEVQSDRATLRQFIDDSELLCTQLTIALQVTLFHSSWVKRVATIRPVLKHGPRSSTGLRVVEYNTMLFNIITYGEAKANWCEPFHPRWCWCSTGWSRIYAEIWAYTWIDNLLSTQDWLSQRAHQLRPERWWTMLGHGEARWKLGGSLRCAELTCKSLPPDLSIGAKDSSNHLVAGSLRSFP